MALRDLIEQVSKATGPERSIDGAIGLLMGWKRKVDYEQAKGTPTRMVSWFLPDGITPGKVPEFTRHVDAAVQLAEMVSPGCTYGIGSKNGRSRATINEDHFSEAATPALAMCASALKLKSAQDGDDE